MSVVKSEKYSFQFWEVACFKWPGLFHPRAAYQTMFQRGRFSKDFSFFLHVPFPHFYPLFSLKVAVVPAPMILSTISTCWKPRSTQRTAWGSEGRAWTLGTLWSRLRADCQTWTPPSRGGSCGWWRGSRQTARPLRSRHGRPSQQVWSFQKSTTQFTFVISDNEAKPFPL